MEYEFESSENHILDMMFKYFKEKDLLPNVESMVLKTNKAKRNTDYPEEVYTELHITDTDDEIHVYSIRYNPYFRCCGVGNLSDYNNEYSMNDKLKYGYILPIVMAIASKNCYAHSVLTMTIPTKEQREAYHIAKKLIATFEHGIFEFKNINSGNNVAHIQWNINPLEMYSFSIYSYSKAKWEELRNNAPGYKKIINHNERTSLANYEKLVAVMDKHFLEIFKPVK